jgi:hypothetical protein
MRLTQQLYSYTIGGWSENSFHRENLVMVWLNRAFHCYHYFTPVAMVSLPLYSTKHVLRVREHRAPPLKTTKNWGVGCINGDEATTFAHQSML